MKLRVFGLAAASALSMGLSAAAASDIAAIGSAAALNLGDARESAISAGERECYRVATGGKPVTVHLEPNEQGPEKTPLFNRAVRVYDDGKKQIEEKIEMADDERQFSVSSKSRSLYICVAGAHDGWVGEYRLRVEAGSS